jgi:lambda family phage tail tape measure protein
MANTIARLGVRLGIDSAEFSKGIEAAKKDLASFASEAKNYALVGATAFAAMTYKALAFADSIADVAKANEMAITTVIKLGEALDQNGGSAENAGKILNAFTSFVDKAATGSFEAQQAFKEVGISLKDLGTLSMEELFARTLKGLKEIPDQLTRQARSYEILGRAIKGAEVAGVADDMEKTSHVSKEQAKSIEDAAKAWDKLHKITHEVLVEFTAFIGTPALNFLNWLDAIAKKAENASDAFTNLGRNMKMLFDFTTAFGFAMFGADAEKLKKFNDEYAKFQKLQSLGKFDTNSSDSYDVTRPDGSIKRKTKEGKDPEAAKAEAERLRVLQFNIQQRQKEGKVIEDNMRRLQEVFATEVLRQDALQRTLKDEQDLFELSLKQRHMRAEDVQLAKDLLEIESNRKKNIREIGLNTDLNLAAQTQLIEREGQLANEAERLARARNQMTKELREGTFGQGFGMAMENAFRNMSTELERGQQAFESVMGNMNAALDNFVRTGKLSFKDLARSIIQDLISIELKAQAMSIFKSMGGMGMFSSLFGGGAPANIFNPDVNYRAEGGGISANSPYIVGERGPELIVPSSSGTVIPNNMLGSMGSNQPSVTYNGPYIAQMSAIDTQSATQFLAKNKSAVWAANQTAQRSLPQSR